MTLSLSLVLPVYNEGGGVAACLDSVVAQTRPVDEVVIVDNNSTDGTRAIVDSYADRLPLVVLNEAQQGLMYARTTGLNAATGDVIGRTDGDAILPPEWCEQVVRFMEANPELDALTGPVLFHDNPGAAKQERRIKKMWPKLLAAPPEKDTWPLAGGNNVLRKRAWEAVKPHLIGRANLHEDIDIACAADKVGLKMWYCHTVYVLVSARRFKSPFDEIKPYIQTTLDTIEAHGLKDRAEWYKGQMPQVTKSFRLLWLIQHNYNPETKRFVPFFLMRNKESRVSPLAD